MTNTILDVAAPLTFRSGAVMKNRFMLAPLTNSQSHPDGTLSDDERRWLTMRAEGGFGAVMTAAAHVQANGQGFPGQLGVFDDRHIDGLRQLADELRADGAVALVQLQHSGKRAVSELIGGPPVSASADDRGTRALTLDEVHAARDAFIDAARRCQIAGMDGVELHGAHGYLIAQFLSAEFNRRTDEYGGTLENRARFLMEIIAGVHDACGPNFVLGVRISPERFGIQLDDALELSRQLLVDDRVDFLDVSLWDTFKTPADESYGDRPLAEYFAELPRDGVALGFAGKLYQPDDVRRAMEFGIDFVLLGRAAILAHDFPARYLAAPNFEAPATPVTRQHLADEGVSPIFVDYLAGWEGFVSD